VLKMNRVPAILFAWFVNCAGSCLYLQWGGPARFFVIYKDIDSIVVGYWLKWRQSAAGLDHYFIRHEILGQRTYLR